ncbi:MAG: hypothetical protein Q9190_002508 [Brigantiaea leucoxantha]
MSASSQDRIVRPYDLLGLVKIVSSTRHLLKKTALDNIVSLFEKYGETFASRLLAQKVYFTCDVQNIRHVLVTGFADYDNSTVRVHLFRPITEHGIFAVDGHEWKIARDLYRSQFSSTRSIVDFDMQEYHFQRFLDHIPEKTPVDLAPLFSKLVVDMTSAFALGESAESLNPDQPVQKQSFVSSLIFAKKIMGRDGFLGPLHVLLGKKEFHRACDHVKKFVEPLIDRQLQQKNQRSEDKTATNDSASYCMLREIAKSTDDRLELRDGIITILIAGIDSVSSLLGTTFWLLARNERVFQKLRAHIIDGVGQEKPTYDQLKNLVYLRYVFNESKNNRTKT